MCIKITKETVKIIDGSVEPNKPLSFDEVYETCKNDFQNVSDELVAQVLFEIDRDQYEFEPVSIEEFIFNDNFLGKTVGKTLYPIWVETLKKIYPTPYFNQYNEVIVSAGIGVGKTVLATVGLLYNVYKVLCLKSPQTYYGLMPDVKIAFMMFSKTKGLAQSVNFDYLSTFLSNSKFFRDRVKIPKTSSGVQNGINLSKNVWLEIGSQISHALGKAVFGAVLDEANFQNEGSQQAEKIYSGILNRMESRFAGSMGVLPSILFVVSSPKNANSFLEERLDKARSVPSSFILENVAMWEVKGFKKNQYSGKMFKVFMGSDVLDPCIIDNTQFVTDEMLENTIDVPIEFYDSFKRDLLVSINDIAGRKVGNILNLFKSRQKLIDMMASIPTESRFTKPLIELSFSDKTDTLSKYINLEYFKNPYKKHLKRYIHIDLSKNRDRTGIASVFCDDIQIKKSMHTEINYSNQDNLYKQVDSNSHITTVKERMYYVDFAIGLVAKDKEEIPFFKIVEFLRYLKDLGYPIDVVTSDSYQGDYLRQELVRAGFKAEYLTVSSKRNREGRMYHINFKDAVQRNKVICMNNPYLYDEMVNLIDNGEVIDHPPTNHNDITHGVIGAFVRCDKSRPSYSNLDVVRYELEKQQPKSELGILLKLGQKEKLNKSNVRKLDFREFI